MRLRFLSIIVFLLLKLFSYSQEYNYQHYDLTNGLSGLTVYSIAQDKNSYLWFATETGVSRFDGINFKNFTTSDGLPDNEVLKLFVDSKNRVWMLPFTNSICYYENGKVHSPKNDSTLAKIDFVSEPRDIMEDENGNIGFIGISSINIIDTLGNIHYFKSYQSHALVNNSVGKNNNGNIVILTTVVQMNSLSELELDKNNFSLSKNRTLDILDVVNTNTVIRRGRLLVYPDKKKVNINIDSINIPTQTDMPDYLTSFSYINDSLITINCSDKVLLYNINQRKNISRFSIKTQVNCCFRDSENNYWFATNGYGVFRIGSLAFKNYELYDGNISLPVYSISQNKNDIVIGTTNGLIWNINLLSNELSYTKLITPLGGRVTSLISDTNQLMVGGNGLHFIKNRKEELTIKDHSVKNIFFYHNKFLVTTGRMVYEFQKNKPYLYDTIWPFRATCAYKFDSSYYIGTIAGLYGINTQKKQTFIGRNLPLLASRISQIAKQGDTLWIATYGNGVVAYAFDRIAAHITDHDGLTSNMCRTIEIYNNKLLVGTDKGLNIVSILDSSQYKISSYNASNGLICDIVNCTFTDHDTIFVGTPYGLTFFNPAEVDNNSIAVLNIDNIASRKYKWTSNDTSIHLDPDDNRLSAEFSCVSFKSQGNITYNYRLIGADDQWHATKENKLDFPSLTPGDYKLELYAINAFGKQSNKVVIAVTIDKYFYQQLWFILLMSLVSFGVLWFLISKRITKIRKNENEKLVIQKRLSELEQLAFRAQMNPHFIFNCLNSIQQYIFSKNAIDANKFITEFASLIRQTMDLSARKLITLDEEIKFLNTYLKLEHTRFEENFDYDMQVETSIDSENIYIPSLLLQPFLENSIRHGIRNLKDKRGKVNVNFSLIEHFLICKIEDNGIGIAASKALKSSNPEEHESKGISLIQKRIEVLNIENDRKISLDIKNSFQNEPNVGTTVILHIPDNL